MLVSDPTLGLSPVDVARMPVGEVWSWVAFSEQRARLRERAR